MSRQPREQKKMGKRIFVFIVGGATRSEVRIITLIFFFEIIVVTIKNYIF